MSTLRTAAVACLLLSGVVSAATVQFSSANYSRSENGGNVQVAVRLTGTISSNVSVTLNIGVAGSTASPGSDYSASTPQTLTFFPGQTQQTVFINIVNDTLQEPDETIKLSLTSPSGVTLGSPNTATVTIIDDDTPPVITISPATVTINEGATINSITFTVRLSRPYSQSITVPYSTAGLSATPNQDFQSVTNGQVTVSQGQTSATFTINIINDTQPEPNETFEVRLGTPSRGTLGTPNKATVTIVDNDTIPVVSFTASTYSVNESSANAVVTVRLSQAIGVNVTVRVTTLPGTAISPQDFGSVDQTVTITAGATTATVLVPIVNDTISESNETFTVRLANPVNATLGNPNQATVTIVDNDVIPVVQFEFAAYSVAEAAGQIVIRVVLSQAVGQNVSVNYATGDITAAQNSDYSPRSGTLTIPAGQTAASIAIPILNDTLQEPDETFRVTLSNPSNATLGTRNPVVVTILDDDTPVTVQFAAASSIVLEGSTAFVTVTLNRVSSVTVNVNYTTVNGTAQGGTDYQVRSGTLSIPAGSLSATISVPTIQDDLAEVNETFSVTLSQPVNATIGNPGTHTVTIIDDDRVRQLQFQNVLYTVNENAGSLTVTVFNSQASLQTITVQYTTENGTATAPGDYSSRSGTLTFAPLETEKTIVIPIVNDNVSEPTEEFTVRLSTATPAGHATVGAGNPATIRILDDDTPTVGVSATDDEASEPGADTGTFTFGRAGNVAAALTVNVTWSGSAVKGTDYAARGGTVTFPAGQAFVTVTVTPLDDDFIEGDETAIVTINAGTGYTVDAGTATASVTIHDNDSNRVPEVLSGPTATPNPITLE